MQLPLFPLNSVLFPGATMPIHVFEERYKQMVKHCLETGSSFGVALIRSGNEVGDGPAEPFDVGTVARIVRIQRLDEGRMNLICLGERRFRLLRRLEEHPYPVGEIEPLASLDANDPAVPDLADTATALFAEYYRLYLAVSNQWSRQIGLPGDPDQLADFVASRMSLNLWTKQRLLEQLSVRRRLEMEIEELSDAIRDMTPKVEAARAQRWRAMGAIN